MISRKQLDALVSHSAASSVSIWMPVHRAGPDIRQDPIRLRNLVTRVQEQLTSLGMRAPDAEQSVSPVRDLADDGDFWRHQYSGLAVFLGEGEPEVLRLPVTPPELVTVCDHFCVKPLFGMLRRSERYYVLALSENTVRLLRGNGSDLVQLQLPKAPSSFAQFLRFDDPERHVDFHTGTGGYGPREDRPAVFHGHGAAAESREEKKRLMDYCRKIDADVTRLLGDEQAPLLLASAEPLHGIFRHVSSCPQLDARYIAGNPDEVGTEELERQAAKLLRKDWADPIRAAAERYGQAAPAGLAEDDLETILPAASAGAVELLLVSLGEQCWGRFSSAQRRVDVHDAQRPGDEELLNLAAVLAHRGGATVHAVESEHLPGDSPVAAILRFRLDA